MAFPILTILILLPALGAGIIVLSSYISKNDLLARKLALAAALITLFLSIILWIQFNPELMTMQFVEKYNTILGHYSLGIDGYSIPFILLTAFLIPICILASWNSISYRISDYMVCFLIMESFIIGVFCATDLLLFFVFFESVLIPMYLIIGVWGSADRVYAAFKFFLYTLAGSVFMLLAVIYIIVQIGSGDFIILSEILPDLSLTTQKWLWLAFFISFAVKIPMWPVHTWLPDAHVQAPTAGSVILAGVLLKLGGYGMLRLSLPMLPQASAYFADFIFWLSIIAVIYTSLVALMQEDMKKLVAYSSIAHMGFVTAGLFSFNQIAIEGAIFQMISHGLTSGALFLCVGILYDRMHTKEIAFYNGLTTKMPKFAFLLMLFTLASIGLPATSGFVGEFLVLFGVFKVNRLFCTLIATGMVLGAAYMLWLYARIMFGEIKNKKLESITDLNPVEKICLWPIAVAVLILGVYPNIITYQLHSVSKKALIEAFPIEASDKVGSNKATNLNVIYEQF